MTAERYSGKQIPRQGYPIKSRSAKRIGGIGGKENFPFLPSQAGWFFSGILFFALLLRREDAIKHYGLQLPNIKK